MASPGKAAATPPRRGCPDRQRMSADRQRIACGVRALMPRWNLTGPGRFAFFEERAQAFLTLGRDALLGDGAAGDVADLRWRAAGDLRDQRLGARDRFRRGR